MLSDPWSVAHVSALEILHQLLYNHGTLIVILGSSSGVQLGLGPFQNKKKIFRLFGGPQRSRTLNLSIRSRTLYPVELAALKTLA